jgi:SAM-dependent methyltransferase
MILFGAKSYNVTHGVYVPFKIDRSLNYGRHIVRDFASSLGRISTCLDVGAGSGQDLDIIRTCHPEGQYHAIESWKPNVEILEKKAIQVIQLNFEENPLPYADCFFDLIISNQVLEHTKEIFWTMHEVTRTLKVGGHLIIGIPNLASFHNRLLLLAGHQPTCIQNKSAHIRGFTSSDLLSFMNIFPNGYKQVAMKGSNFYPFPALLARPLARAFPSLAWSNFFLLKKVSSYEDSFYVKYPVAERLETNFKCL